MRAKLLGATMASVLLLSAQGEAQVVFGRAGTGRAGGHRGQARGNPGHADKVTRRTDGPQPVSPDRATPDRSRDGRSVDRPAVPLSTPIMPPIPPPLSPLAPAFWPHYGRTLRPERHHKLYPRYYSHSYGTGYAYGAAAHSSGGYGAPSSDDRRSKPATTGSLRLQVEPGTAQVYVDRYYVGFVRDHNELALEAGPHHLEIRAPGYQSLSFDVRIFSSRTTTYQADLQLAEAKPPVSSIAPSGPTILYVIPGCYAGNVPPTDFGLPAGCDVTKLRQHRF